MEKYEIIKNIAQRTGGDIYLGVVGAVRTGKSTFIKKMVETLVVPYIEDEYEKKRTRRQDCHSRNYSVKEEVCAFHL